MTFGAFISTKRKEAKLNLRDTAKHLGIAYGYLCDIEQGRRPAPEGMPSHSRPASPGNRFPDWYGCR